MAYGGKPSRGCQMCRIRRIKCDETRPTCKQCVKARRTCPGYRDLDKPHPISGEGNERPQVPDKSQHAAAKSLAPSSKRNDESSSDGTVASYPRSSSERSIKPPPPIPVYELASCHFISNYILIPRRGLATTRGFLDFVLPLLKAPEPSQHFLYAFQACSLASLNNRVGTGNDFDKEALGCYTKALASTFSALKDPVLTRRDDTLAAILLLGLFENITAKTLGMLAWSSHIEGAVQLVKSRGQEQLQSKIGLDLFMAVRTQMIIHALSTGKPPTLDVDWWVADPISNEYSMQFQQLSTRVGELKSEVNALLATVTRSPENTELMKDTIQSCKSLDREIVIWLRELPDQYMWKTVAWEPYNPKCDYSKAEVFPGRIDAYVDLWVVNFWNVMRCMRIVLSSLTIRCTAWIIFPADYRTTAEYATAVSTCVEASSDIISSVPYQMGLFSKRKDLRGKATHSMFGCGEDASEKGLAGYFLLWPLACIQGQDYLTDSQRSWVKGRLKSIGNTLGVRYGNLLSQLNVRMPSMLILRDRLKNNPQNVPVDIAAIMAGTASRGVPPPTTGASTARHVVSPSMPGISGPVTPMPEGPRMPSASGAPMDNREKQAATRTQMLKRQTEELVTKAVEAPGKLDDWTVKTWLQL
ncbi:Zn(2)-C6 fungal-type DNA-binding domain protein [Metarhizium rileyi]|uniref:Zn(2)-C6 fungal-type DNA-binding domain protein n=1 Tax=Metarhizium rileyi (strain RCEF 4871) TaxID=1649241 RepID=A0A162JIZ6_METRR|nr:Zn(2)-C6 fungal-type DNA-binding domain protein [Metarhizium rileyi RCEF 4871]TWU74636.1 hypothetical protein ED733_002644 [Metarhizium rileyi]